MTETVKASLPSGRTFVARTSLSPSENLNLIEIAGLEAASNAVWLRIATVVVMVTEIDGVPVQTPQTKKEILARADRIGMDGINAVWDTLYPRPVPKPEQSETTSEAAPEDASGLTPDEALVKN